MHEQQFFVMFPLGGGCYVNAVAKGADPAEAAEQARIEILLRNQDLAGVMGNPICQAVQEQ